MPQGERERKRKVNFAAQLLFAVDQMQHLSFEMMKRDYLLERRRTEFVRKITLQYFCRAKITHKSRFDVCKNDVQECSTSIW